MTVKTEKHPAAPAANTDPNELVSKNLPLVKYILGKLSRNLPPSVDKNDLIAAGSLGLTEAARRYDPSRNVPFHSYAIPRIWGAMLDELRSHDWLSADLRDQVKRVQAHADDLQKDSGAPPSIEDIAGRMGCTAKRVSRLLALAHSEGKSANDSARSELEENELRSRLGTQAPRNPYEQTEFNDQKRALATCIASLPERERQVIMLRYHEELMLHEIGALLGVTESRICQIHAQALKRLRGALRKTDAL